MDPSSFFAYPDSVTPKVAGFLAGFHDDEIRDILGYMQTRSYVPGEMAVRRGDAGSDLFIVTSLDYS